MERVGKSKFAGIADLPCNEPLGGRARGMASKSRLLDLKTPPQDMVGDLVQGEKKDATGPEIYL